VRRMAHRTMAAAQSTWRWMAKERRRRRQIVGRALVRMGHITARAAMIAWSHSVNSSSVPSILKISHIVARRIVIRKLWISFFTLLQRVQRHWKILVIAERIMYRIVRHTLSSVVALWVQYSQVQRRMSISGYLFLRHISNRTLALALEVWRKAVSKWRLQNFFVCSAVQRARLSSAAWTLRLWRDYILGRIRWAVTVHNADLRARHWAVSSAFFAWAKIFSAIAAQTICFRRLAGATRRHCAGELARFHRAWARQVAMQLSHRRHAVTGLMRTLRRSVCSALLVWRQYAAAERGARIAGTLDLAKAAAICIDAAVVGIREGIYQVGFIHCCVCCDSLWLLSNILELFACFSQHAMVTHHLFCNRLSLWS